MPAAEQIASGGRARAEAALLAAVDRGRAGRLMLERPELVCEAIPELRAARGFDQRSVYHVYDVYEHIAHVCCACEAFAAGLARPELRWAALLHDVGKPATFSLDEDGHGHFFGHPAASAAMAADVMCRLGVPASTRERAELLIRLHDERMSCTTPAVRALLRSMHESCPGHEVPLAFALFNLRRADAVSKCASAASWASTLDHYALLLRREVARGPVFAVEHLAVADLAATPGMRMQLEMLLRAVMADEVPNEREALLAWLGWRP